MPTPPRPISPSTWYRPDGSRSFLLASSTFTGASSATSASGKDLPRKPNRRNTPAVGTPPNASRRPLAIGSGTELLGTGLSLCIVIDCVSFLPASSPLYCPRPARRKLGREVGLACALLLHTIHVLTAPGEEVAPRPVDDVLTILRPVRRRESVDRSVVHPHHFLLAGSGGTDRPD